mmetsp:Transcript_32533/g.62694  ORF Transcript_32533/g.62694 Transcript_32533/m.62694 type:complete len:254 (+) Transcript_32533:597-1358(+)
MRHTDDSAFKDTVLRIQQKLNLFGIDVVAARNDQILVATDDVQISILVELTQIARDEKAVFAQFLGCFLGHLPIPFKDVRATHLDLANVPLGKGRPGGAVRNLDLDPRQREAHCACAALPLIGVGGVHIGFRHAIALKDTVTGSLFKLHMRFRQQWRAARDEQPHILRQLFGEARILQQPGIEGRNTHHRGGAWHLSDDDVQIKFGHKHHLATGQQRNIRRYEQAVRVENRQSVQQNVIRCKRPLPCQCFAVG